MNVLEKPSRVVDASTPDRVADVTSRQPYQQPAEAVVRELKSDPRRGLTQAAAQERLERHGPNELKGAAETPWWRRLLEQFENFLVIILLVAIVISTIEWTLQDPRESALPYEAIVITIIVVLNAILGYVQEFSRREIRPRADGARSTRSERGARWRAPARSSARDRPRRHRADRGG